MIHNGDPQLYISFFILHKIILWWCSL